jgi:Domain of unknown function (DUF4082)
MKHIRLFSPVLFCLCFAISCKKSSSSPASAGQTPFQTVVSTSSVVNSKAAYTQNTGGFEVGYMLHFTKSGTVTKLGTEMGTTGTYAVSFWQNSTQLLLGTVNVNVTDTSHFFYVALSSSISVIADTEYVLSFHVSDEVTTSHWLYSNSNGSTNLYPFTVGNVVVDQCQDLIGLPANNTPTFPSTYYAVDQAYLNDCDLVYTPSN